MSLLPPDFRVPRPRQRGTLVLPYTGQTALAIDAIATPQRPIVVLCADAAQIEPLQASLRFFAPQRRVGVFPDWETLPYDPFSPHQDIISQRLATLHALTQRALDVLITSVSAAMPYLAPRAFVAGRYFRLACGEIRSLESLKTQLVLAGYQPVTQVVHPGEFAQRGGILDLYPMGAALPFRLEWCDEEIETIKTFDPDTQRTLYPVPAIELLPAREFPTDEAGRATFRRRWREIFEGDPSKSRWYKDVSQGHYPGGIEYFLPLFFDTTETFFDYCPEALWVRLGDVAAAAEAEWKDAQERYRLLNTDPSAPLLPCAHWLQSPEAFHRRLGEMAQLDLRCDRQPLPTVALDARSERPAKALAEWCCAHPDWSVLLLVQSAGRRETLRERLHDVGLTAVLAEEWGRFRSERPSLAMAVAEVENGFLWPEERIAVFGEAELFAHLVRTARTRRARREAEHAAEQWIRDLTELTPGAPVVHLEHGIGRYRGLVTLEGPEGAAEFLHLEYADGAALYVPITQLNLIGRYLGGDPDSVTLHRLGSGQWEKEKRKAAEKAHDTAAELLALYAERATRQAPVFAVPTKDYEAFCAGFPFEPTPDQQAAIDAVLQDLASGKPMDRLVCGDVGFGKTEVALRAAFAAAYHGHQVVVLTPTTLLAEQHYQTFAHRFADWPVKVAELSRFRSGKEQQHVLAALAKGELDIVIGTHRLLQPDVRFARLGLVIIDEEHRFGVRQKEALRRLATQVHTLTLTATPIPRTLAMALEGLRDFSVIATAPEKRLAVKTFVVKKNDTLVREAIQRELRRGGQVFYVHNEVQTILAAADEVQRLVPSARIGVAHGQMSETELERVMRDFVHQRLNVLVCTTIIETGIDIPNANTILIERADCLGLAQLHQLRGRVGRSHHQAFAYLMTDPVVKPTPAGQKRLEAIAQLESLGAGFHLAMHDLEIRGAGEVLGEAQSGTIESVGFALYTQMLQEAVTRLRRGEAVSSEALTQAFAPLTEIHLGAPALLPDAYCPDVALRLDWYKRLADAENDDQLCALSEALIDRFGPLPPTAATLIATHRLRLFLAPYRIARVDANAQGLTLRFSHDTPIPPQAVIAAVQQDRRLKLKGPDTLALAASLPDVSARVEAIKSLVRQLSGAPSAVPGKTVKTG